MEAGVGGATSPNLNITVSLSISILHRECNFVDLFVNSWLK